MKHFSLPAMPAGIVLVSMLTLAACSGGGGGGRPSPSPAPAPVDSTPPETTLVTGPPALTSATSATISFSANESGTFEGRLDGGAYAAVTSPHVLNNLADGSHTFEVRARDTASNLDATPASAIWVVDTTPPDTQISAAPSATTVVNTSTFTVSSTEAGGTLEASLDGGAFAPITSPYSAINLADGPHTIRFRATDAAGNVDASPASASWTLDVTPAQVRLIFPTRIFYTDGPTVSVRGTAQDPNGVASLSINGVAAQTADNFAHWNAVIPVPVATTPVTITSRDGPGNTAPVAAATMINRGPLMTNIRGVGYDAARDRIIAAEWDNGIIAAFRASDGIGQVLSDTLAPGQIPGRSLLEGLVIDEARDRVLVVDSGNDALVAVSLANGARTVISPGNGTPSATTINSSYGLALDAINQYAYVTVNPTASVIRINLVNGQRTVASSDNVGTGPSFSYPDGIVFDNVTTPGTPRLLVVNGAFSNVGILAVDPLTGNRTLFSTLGVGSGTALSSPVPMTLDAGGNRVIVLDVAVNTLFAVDLATGNRTQINSASLGSGPFPSFAPSGLVVKPQTRQLFSAQNFGGVFAIDLATQARTELVHSNVGVSDRISLPLNLALEPSTGAPTSLVYLQGYPGMMYRLDLATSNRHIISWAGQVGTGPTLQDSVDFVLDRRPGVDGHAALVLQREPAYKLLSVDLQTGNRTALADIVGNGPAANNPLNLALDVSRNRVLYTNNQTNSTDIDEVYAIDLATGITTAVSDASSGGSANFVVPQHIVLTPATNPSRALVSDTYGQSILAVDLATGFRSLFDSPSTGSGVPYTQVGPMFVDAARSRLLIGQEFYPQHLAAMPLTGGPHELISGTHPGNFSVRGTGPARFGVSAIDVDVVNDVAYTSSGQCIMAIDLVSGDRIVIAH